MGRTATGQVIERRRKNGVVYAIRFRAQGERHYVTLGTSTEGWTRARADLELQNTLADIRRGLWKPPAVEAPAEPPPDWTLHEWASKCLADRRPRLRPRSIESWEWALSNHLLPFFASLRLTEITKLHVHDYVTMKVREREEELVQRPLSNSSINRTVERLADVLEDAVELDLIKSNPAKGRRLRLTAENAKRRWLQLHHVMPMIELAGPDRALVATLLLAGLRIGEALELRWRNIDLTAGTVTIEVSKTEAGVRDVDLTPMLKRELAEHKLRSRYSAPSDPVFPTAAGTLDNRSNVLKRVVRRTVLRVNELMDELELEQAPTDVTNHDLRRVFSSLLDEVNAPRAYKSQQMGQKGEKLAPAYDRPLRRQRSDVGKRIDALVLAENPMTQSQRGNRDAS